ncbi:MAG: Zn-ribbon domain-containing OB-fold protein [Deltaproteobacteria bacterium]|nr:Zn-ribbon domain-containing OB-fold protein [Deltaproteobacteria bacterium]
MPNEKKVAKKLYTSSISYVVDMPYRYNAGYYVSKYLLELKENKQIIGVRCPKCKCVYVPPRVVCKNCFEKTEEFVRVSSIGTVMAYTLTTVPYTDPNTGEPKKLPFTAAYIKLDGTNSNIMHCLEEQDEKKLKTGMRVQAEFNDKRTGDHFSDIKHFKTIKD